jgi:hypothetical protein
MPSHPEASPQATCRATTKAGAPCRKQAVADGFCTFHSGQLDLAELGRKGGRARGRKRDESAGDKLEARAYTALDELLSSGSATARVQAAKYALDRLTANSPTGLEAAKKALWLDQQAERQLALPAARAKLDRLIEARANMLAEEMYEERKRLELEAVKSEMLGGP